MSIGSEEDTYHWNQFIVDKSFDKELMYVLICQLFITWFMCWYYKLFQVPEQ